MAEVEVQQHGAAAMAIIRDGENANRIEISSIANARVSDRGFCDIMKMIVASAYRLGKESR